MTDEPDIERIAATIGDASRVRMLTLLMEGRALTAKELALGAGIEAATASAHLKRLEEDGLLACTSQGRHKYFRFATDEVARVIEGLMRVAPRRAAARGAPAADPERQARFCYDHVAGELGTGLLDLALRKRWLRDHEAAAGQLELTPSGERAMARLGVDVEAAAARRRLFACRCLDWSERRDHLGGALGAALAHQLLALRWIERRKHTRVVRISLAGHEGLQGLGLRLPAG